MARTATTVALPLAKISGIAACAARVTQTIACGPGLHDALVSHDTGSTYW
jgi:hypothetical protein